MSCGTDTPAGRCGAPCEVPPSACHRPPPRQCSRSYAAAGQGDLHVYPVADAVVRGQALDLRPEALLCLDRYDLRACQRGPDGEEAAIGAEVEDPSRVRQEYPVRR